MSHLEHHHFAQNCWFCNFSSFLLLFLAKRPHRHHQLTPAGKACWVTPHATNNDSKWCSLISHKISCALLISSIWLQMIPFNERLYALFGSLSGVPEHSSHTCCSRYAYPNYIINFYLHGCQTIIESSYFTRGKSILMFMYLNWMFIDWMYFLSELLILFFNPKI